jgi:hypothetical protein
LIEPIATGTKSTKSSKPPLVGLKNDIYNEKIAATDDDMPQCAPTEYERRGAATSSLHSKQADMNRRRYESSKEVPQVEKVDDESITKPRESLTYAPSLMAHVYHQHAVAMDGNDENGKD